MALPSNVKYVSRDSDVNRKSKRLKRHKKVNLVFDEEKRREFLGGFHKRKLQRRKRAQEELQHQLKEERKKIKQDARKKYKTLLSRRDVPELEELLSQQEYETEGCTVSILEVNMADLSQRNNLIGENRTTYESDNEKQNSDGESVDNEISGMELNNKKSNKTDSKNVQPVKNFETKKEVKRAVKHAALKQVQKSKAFQLKQRMEHQKNKKQTLRVKQKNDRIMKKHGKKVRKKVNR